MGVKILADILPPVPPKSDWRKCTLNVSRERGRDHSFELLYACEYESPELSFKHLENLSKTFGTTNIDVDNYTQSGCDTCDYGSSYGNTIQLRDVTVNEGILSALVNMGDVYNDFKA
jgi:hypothetical protein